MLNLDSEGTFRRVSPNRGAEWSKSRTARANERETIYFLGEMAVVVDQVGAS